MENVLKYWAVFLTLKPDPVVVNQIKEVKVSLPVLTKALKNLS